MLQSVILARSAVEFRKKFQQNCYPDSLVWQPVDEVLIVDQLLLPCQHVSQFQQTLLFQLKQEYTGVYTESRKGGGGETQGKGRIWRKSSFFGLIHHMCFYKYCDEIRTSVLILSRSCVICPTGTRLPGTCRTSTLNNPAAQQIYVLENTTVQ